MATTAVRAVVDVLGGELLERARQLSEHDPLTGVHNRRYLEKTLLHEWNRAKRYSLQLSVAMLDMSGKTRSSLSCLSTFALAFTRAKLFAMRPAIVTSRLGFHGAC